MECFTIAEKFYGRKFSRPKSIIYKRNGSWGGYCNYHKSELMFQLDFAEHYKDKFLNRTVPHEVAHWIDKEVNGFLRKGSRRDIHGKTWQYIMTEVFKTDASRCHNYDTNVTSVKGGNNYVYECSCMEHTFSSIRHNRARKGKTTYHCRKCGSGLTFKRKK